MRADDPRVHEYLVAASRGPARPRDEPSALEWAALVIEEYRKLLAAGTDDERATHRARLRELGEDVPEAQGSEATP